MFIDSDSDSDLEDAILLYSAVLAESIKKQKKKRQNKSIYLKKRQKSGRFARDFQDLIKDPIRFCENFHMDVITFQRILSMVTPYLKPKKMTRPTDGISPNQKLAAVLEYFACGSLQRHIASVYRISKQHFGKIIDEVSIALISALNEYIPPYDANVMINAANDFNYQWNFPNCVGSIDGKHIAIKCPPKAGSMFFNYKGYHSIVLLAVADAKYKFSYIDVGAYGSEGDAGVFSSSKLGKAMANESLPVPPDAKIHDKRLPFFFVGDDAFPLGKRLIKPYVPKRNQMLEPDKRSINGLAFRNCNKSTNIMPTPTFS
ncbi:putative nuclease HARBI1 [Hermetia illucens]|uniref:putative nuclease HARBI1 n=1 Tax=Hermetia illucens TaxID=343691 RepID=UPI0018CC5AB4|nr:putative nuclease HARBI1 [Hermetia illucens]